MITGKIKIGGIDYTVRLDCNLRNEQDEKLDGHIKYGSAEILINEEQDVQAQYQTLWHELVHGIFTHAGIRDQDEQITELLSYGIVQILRDNKDIIFENIP